jgi:signal recognition particle receptor subunit beta
MPRLDETTQILRFKVVFWGPGQGGKTTALRQIHAAVPDRHKGRLVCLSTETERTLFFDYASVHLGQVDGGGPAVAVDVFTVPGQVFYVEARRHLLRNTDAVAFVADSAAAREAANVESLGNLREVLAGWGLDLDELPLAFLYNKRDLPDAVPVARLRAALNPERRPEFQSVANRGEGVMEILGALCGLLLDRHVFRGAPGTVDGRWFAVPGFEG